MNKKIICLLLLIGLVGCTKTPDSSKIATSNTTTVSSIENSSEVNSSISSEEVSSSSLNNTNDESVGEISSGTGWLPPI